MREKQCIFSYRFVKLMNKKRRSIVNKLEEFTNNKVKFIYHWKTRKLKSLFPLKDRIKHKANIVYKGTYSCNESYGRDKTQYRNKVERTLF